MILTRISHAFVTEIFKRIFNLFKILIAIVLLNACTSQTYTAPVSDIYSRPQKKLNSHFVAKGETLYSIAWRYGLDYKKLAKVNRLDSNYTIFPGQKLSLDVSAYERIIAAEKKSRARKAGSERAKIKPEKTTKIVKANTRKETLKTKNNKKDNKPKSTAGVKKKTPSPKKTIAKVQNTGPVKWHWPIRGPIVTKFSTNGGLNKGIDIRGKLGDSVSAAAGGQVVYAGSGLRGYGKLLIVKHTDKFLSAYAHNSKLLVKEGQAVKAGQKIAELGSSGTNSVKLHFEIRLNGKPVDPIKYLPR